LGAVKLVKTFRPLAAIFGHSLCTKRTAKICFGRIAAVRPHAGSVSLAGMTTVLFLP